MEKNKTLKEAMKAAKATRKSQQVAAQPITETKVNISIRLDLEVLNWLKDEGKRQGLPYQTLINSILKKTSSNETIEERLSRIEKALFKKSKVG